MQFPQFYHFLRSFCPVLPKHLLSLRLRVIQQLICMHRVHGQIVFVVCPFYIAKCRPITHGASTICDLFIALKQYHVVRTVLTASEVCVGVSPIHPSSIVLVFYASIESYVTFSDIPDFCNVISVFIKSQLSNFVLFPTSLVYPTSCAFSTLPARSILWCLPD